jgi:DUF1680 family protein
MAQMNRRQLLACAATAVAVGAMERFAIAAPDEAGHHRLRQFSYSDVKLKAGPLKDQFDHTLAYYKALDEDRVLKVYRQRTGLPAPGADMGGWYDPNGFAPGHCFGQWVSALSRYFAATGDQDLRAKVERLVDGFDQTLKGTRSFYDDHPFRAYCYDKHVLGLIEAYKLCGIGRAREILVRATDQAVKFLPPKAETRQEQAKHPHKDPRYTWDESYTLAENLFLAHEVMQDERYLEMAKKYLHDKPYFDPLARGENVLPGLHAYSHVNALSSAARAYEVLGDEKYLQTITNAWDMLESTQWFASSGWGPNEEFVQPGKGLLGKSIFTTRNHFETPCGSYAQFKLARYLMRFTNKARYGDGLELMLYNGILAAKPMGPDGQTFYYSDYGPLARKDYRVSRWPCCAGTYPQVVVDYLVSAYLHDDDGIYVNLYVPSEVKWKSVRLVQETTYPEQGTSHITVYGSGEFAIRLRRPQWAKSMSVQVNAEPQHFTADPRGFVEVSRQWKDQDFIKVEIPLHQRQEPVDHEHPELVAVMRGPVMMVATMDPAVAVAGDSSVTHKASLVPFYRVRDEVYTSYLTRS